MIIRLRHTDLSRTALASGRQADTIQDRDAGQQMSAGLITPRISLSSAGRSFISQDVDTCGRPPQANTTCNGQPSVAVSGPETWNSVPAKLRLSTLSTATFARRLKAHLFVSTE